MIKLKDLKNKYKLEVVKNEIVNSSSDAVNVSDKIGYPVALKIDSEDILHKSDIGGVKLDINNEKEVQKAYEDILDSVNKKMPEAKINGIQVQEMIGNGFEVIVGFENDRIYGPTLMLGMGGIFTEAFKDVSFRLLPVKKEDIVEMIESLKFSELLFNGFRNIPPVSKDILIDAIEKIARMALDNEKSLNSFDINPITFWGDNYRIVDFKYVKSKDEDSSNTQNININDLDNFFNAKSIALVGATNKKDSIGYVVMDNLLNHGYRGRIYPINPKYDKIANLKSYPSIIDIPGQIDLAVVTVALKRVPDLLKQCQKKNVKSMIIISAGGKEIGENEIEQHIKNIANEYGIRIIGCNCLGVFDGNTRIDTLFQPYENMIRPKEGTISLISQSGTVGISSLELLKDYGVGKFVSYGNRIDVDEGDLISYFTDDRSTDVLAIYIEGLEKGRKFYEAAKKMSKIKPVVTYKAGRSPQASEAALSHTGFLTGTHNLIEGVMDQAGIVQVDSLESLLASAKTLSRYKRIDGNRALIITNGAGTTIQAIDRIVSKNRIDLARLSKETISDLNEQLPGHVIIGNPIDLTGTATDEQFEISIKAAVDDKNIDIIMAWFVFQCKPVTENIAAILGKYAKEKPIVCGAIGMDHTHKLGKLIEDKKVPIFYSVEEWVSAAEAVYKK
jgi:3-hydroxypropionyl-CoA synthetase (ADP-forming)